MIQKIQQAHQRKYQTLNPLLGKVLKGLKVGIPSEFIQDGMSEDIIEMWT